MDELPLENGEGQFVDVTDYALIALEIAPKT